MAKRLTTIVVLAAMCVPVRTLAVGHERIPLDHWSYRALERFESLGMCVLPDDRPFTRDEITRIAETIESTVDPERLCARDRELVTRLAREFTAADARDDPGLRYDRAWYGRDGGVAVEGDFALRPYLEQTPFSNRVEAFVGVDPEIRVHLGDRFSYDLRYRLLYGPEHGERADDAKPSRREKSFNGLTSLFERSYVSGVWDAVELVFGRDHVDWGPSEGGSLITPGDRHSMDQIGLRVRFRSLRLDAYYAQLFTDPERYMAGHRLEARVGRSVFGISETVVYGGRPLDWLYVWPVAWYYANQFNERTNDDNILWSIDAKTNAFDALTVYGSLLIDDFQFERDEGFPDKLAADLGLRWVPARPWGLELRAQYRWVDLYTYSHSDSLSVYVSGAGELEGGDVLLGGAPGPDADAWFVDAEVYPRPDLRLSAGVFGGRVGEGNDVTPFDAGVDARDPPFPSGVVEESVGARFGVRWEWDGDRWVAIQYSHASADNRGHIAGADDATDAFRLEIRWDIP